MTTAESWRLTPREFEARAKVFRDYRDEQARLWLLRRVDILNGPHFHRKDERPYAIEDFTAQSFTPSVDRVEQDRADLARELARDKINAQQMHKPDYDDSWLPGWARMTEAEKAR